MVKKFELKILTGRPAKVSSSSIDNTDTESTFVEINTSLPHVGSFCPLNITCDRIAQEEKV